MAGEPLENIHFYPLRNVVPMSRQVEPSEHDPVIISSPDNKTLYVGQKFKSEVSFMAFKGPVKIKVWIINSDGKKIKLHSKGKDFIRSADFPIEIDGVTKQNAGKYIVKIKDKGISKKHGNSARASWTVDVRYW